MLRTATSLAMLVMLAVFASRGAAGTVPAPLKECHQVCEAAGFLLPNTTFNPVSCEHVCDNIARGLNGTARGPHAGCLNALGALTHDDVKATQAIFSSSNILPMMYMLAKTGGNVTAKTAEALKFLGNGHLDDLGHPAACHSVPGLHYCSVHISKGVVDMALCMPQECNATDLMPILNATLGAAAAGSPPVPKLDIICGFTSYEIDVGAGIMIGIIAVLVSLLLVASLCLDTHAPPKSCAGKMLFAFSFQRNYAAFTRVRRDGDFAAFDGMRVVSMMWVVMGHVALFQLTTVGLDNIDALIPETRNSSNDESERKRLFSTFTGQVLPSAEFSVDTFFFMSGFLATFLMVVRFVKSFPKGKLWLPMLYVFRFLRITPLYMFVIFFWMKIGALLGSGPFWSYIQAGYKPCEQNWWTNLLYINNLVGTDAAQGGCYGVSWYLANDMQFFILVPIFAVFFVKARGSSKLEWATISAPLVLATLSCALSTYMAQSSSPPLRFQTFDAMVDHDQYFNDYYIKPWARCPPYLIGISAAMIWFKYFHGPAGPSRSSDSSSSSSAYHHHHQQQSAAEDPKESRTRRRVVFSTTTVAAIAVVALALLGGMVYAPYTAYQTVPSTWGQGLTSFYLAWSKSIWTIGLVLLLFLCFNNQGGVIQRILEAPVFSVLMKLTFGMYLIHPAIIDFAFYSRESRFYFTNWQYAVTFSGILLLVAGAASVLYFLVEKPTAHLVGQLQGALTGGGRGRRRRSAQQEAMNMASGAGYAPINADGHERDGLGGGGGDMAAPLLTREDSLILQQSSMAGPDGNDDTDSAEDDDDSNERGNKARSLA